jgi:subfamily B ATP-binding cassette protein MsbA
MAFYLSWELTLVALLILPSSFFIIGYIGSRLRRASSLSQEKMAEVTSVLQETISGARVVKAFAMEEFEMRKFQRVARDYFKALLHITRVSKVAGPLTEFLGAVVGVGILWYGGRQVLTGEGLSPGEFMLFLLAIFSLMQPVKELSSVNNRLQEAAAAGERIFEIIDLEPEVASLPGAHEIDSFEQGIRFERLTFAYANEKDMAPAEVLREISFEIKKGEILAIVGPSGAGKSTLVDLLPRFYDPQQGRILLDGRDLREINVKSLRRLMGIVTQETILFHDTVRNNIAYGLQEISAEKLVQAAKAAGLLSGTRGSSIERVSGERRNQSRRPIACSSAEAVVRGSGAGTAPAGGCLEDSASWGGSTGVGALSGLSATAVGCGSSTASPLAGMNSAAASARWITGSPRRGTCA